ncbi:MAG TPA: hypothetical protein VLK27_01735 [Chthoniobacterales bacterium]|nr:hypothetical protein [Chthoniobacterales bacterium]
MKKLTVLIPCVALALLLSSAASSSAVTLLGSPFRPTGANFDISAVQGINASHPTGDSSFSPQVNKDFEFPNTIGVSYQQNGQLTDFGLGLYSDANNAINSTGLHINYDSLVKASSITITLADFDISSKDTFFNPNKVEPVITLFGPGGSIFATAGPHDIFPNMTLNTTSPANSKSKGDVWDISFAGLLNTLHLADGPITGFLLSADMAAGEKPNSDPYLLVAVGNGIPTIPEASNYMAGVAAILFAGLFHLRQFRLRKRAAMI